jgi:hypothetical protein
MVPVHKPEPSADEIMSLQACKKQLHAYHTYLVFPEGMDTTKYLAVHSGLKLKPVNPVWLSTILHYNKMKYSLEFYLLFRQYNFMLTYELDSYIFHADFERYNVFSFDYIGAPFYEGYLKASPTANFIQGGNSGFSIRNIQGCIEVLQTIKKKFQSRWNFYKNIAVRLPRIKYHLNRLTKGKYDAYLTDKLAFYFADDPMNEDLVWSQIVPSLYPDFKVADPISSLRFSFEAQPERLLKMNGGQLPLGCHGWIKNQNFWKDYIDIKNLV